MSPTPRMTTQLIRSRTSTPAGDSQHPGDSVTTETVADVSPDGKYGLVRGVWAIAHRNHGIAVGDVVRVQWCSGRGFILEANFRRGGLHDTIDPAQGVVEEIYVGQDDKGQTDVIFRDGAQVTALALGPSTADNKSGIAKLPGTPVSAFWGANADVFAVLVGTDQYFVYQMDRDPNKVLTGTASIKQLLYSQKLSDVSLPVLNLTVKMHRDSVEPFFLQVWDFGNTFFPIGTPPADSLNQVLNVNKADITRQVVMNLAGATSVTFQSLTPGTTPGQVVVNAPAPSLLGVVVDGNNDLIYSVGLAFNSFGLQQGPKSGLSGSYHRLGTGNPYPWGFFDSFSSNLRTDPNYPFVLDDVGVLDFSGAGNPGGVLQSFTTEQHSVVINARERTILFSTMAATTTLNVEESTNGQVPYIASHYVNIPDLGLHDPNVGPDHGYTYTMRSSNSNIFGPVLRVRNYNQLGLYGVIKSERSLFDPALPFRPEQGVARTAQVVANTSAQAGWNCERHDGFDTFDGHAGSFFANGEFTMESHWTNPTVDTKDRYQVNASVTPFWVANGQVYSFVVVTQVPKRPNGETDPLVVGVFVMVGLGSGAGVIPLLPYRAVPDGSQTPALMTGNANRVLWKIGQTWFMTDLTSGAQKQVGQAAGADPVPTLVLTNPDLLYDSKEDPDAGHYFVDGWTDKAITLNQGDKDFPPRDLTLGPDAGRLADTATGVPFPTGSFHVIEDAQQAANFPQPSNSGVSF